MRELDSTDLLIICAASLDATSARQLDRVLAEACDLIRWWVYPPKRDTWEHPAMKWWLTNNASAVQRLLAQQHLGRYL